MIEKLNFIFEKIFLEYQKKSLIKPFVIGISGIDGSGKTTISKLLSSFLRDKNLKTQLVHIDDFHNPKAIRYKGIIPEYEKYFHQSFNIEKLVDELLIPIKNKEIVDKKLTLLNLETDEYDMEREYFINQDTIIILEGVFLFRPELIKYIDYKIFIHIPFEDSKNRELLRNPNADLTKYDTKYIPAQKKYSNNEADITINNTEYNLSLII